MAELCAILTTTYIKDLETMLSMRTTSKILQSTIDLQLRKKFRSIFKEEPSEEIANVINELREVYCMPTCTDCERHREILGASYRCYRRGCRGQYMNLNGDLL